MFCWDHFELSATQRTSCCCCCRSWMSWWRLKVTGWFLQSAIRFVCSSRIRPLGQSWTEGWSSAEMKSVSSWRLGQDVLSQLSESCNPAACRPWEDGRNTQTYTWLMLQKQQRYSKTWKTVLNAHLATSTKCNTKEKRLLEAQLWVHWIFVRGWVTSAYLPLFSWDNINTFCAQKLHFTFCVILIFYVTMSSQL